jgi:hypothetical protein
VYFDWRAHSSCVWLGCVASRPEQVGSPYDTLNYARCSHRMGIAHARECLRELLRVDSEEDASTCPSDKNVSDGKFSCSFSRMSYDNRRIRVCHDVLKDFSWEHVMVRPESGARVWKGQSSGDAGSCTTKIVADKN